MPPMPTAPLVLKAISSMATRQVLAALAQQWQALGGAALHTESVGGVDAAKRVQAGEALDLVFLAHDALLKLAAAGHVLPDTVLPLMRSGVAVALPQGTPKPAMNTEADLQHAVLVAATVGYSTGPSGTALLALFDRWGVRTALGDRLVQAPPGVPVAQLVAQGQVALGFQQLSELLHVPGIDIVPMPDAVQIDTVFSGAVASACTDPQRQALSLATLAFMASEQAHAARHAQGMRAP